MGGWRWMGGVLSGAFVGQSWELLNKIESTSLSQGFGSGSHTEFFVDPSEMPFDGVHGKEEPFSNLLILHAVVDE